MKEYCLFLMLCFVKGAGAAQNVAIGARDVRDTSAVAPRALATSHTATPRAQFSLATGYQSMDFHWSIAGNISGSSPNVYSELIWKSVRGPALNAAIQYPLGKRIYLSGDYNHVFIRSGGVSDKDYKGDNRTEQTYQGDFSSNKGYAATWSASVGYAVVENRRFSLIPFIGYGTSEQSLYLLDNSPMTGILNSTYKTNWYGPLVKVRSSLHLTGRWGLGADITYHQVDYRAKADWNLIETFQHPVSFSHSADGFGIEGTFHLDYSLTRRLAITVGARYFDWQTGTGIDQLYLVSGQTDKTQMNGAVSRGWGCLAGLNILF